MPPTRVGLIGFGKWARTAYVPVLETIEHARVVAVSARSESSRRAAVEALDSEIARYATGGICWRTSPLTP